uniref:globin-3-like n=1 Tax=Myxine glutinosa TaxID=7769 RepID=UPI00358ED9C6
MPITDQGPLPTLSDCDKKAIRSTWPEIYNNFEHNSLKVLLGFLKNFPDAQLLFPKFADVKKGDLHNDTEVKWQACRIINAVNDVIGHLDNEVAMKQYLKELSVKHSSEFQVDPKLFKELSAIFVSTIGGKAAYEKLFSIISILLRSTYHE